MSESPEPERPTAEDATQWLVEHGDVLYRYALKRIGAPDVAEDLVQETFVAALRSRESFAGRSSVQTWLVGILRHKVVDYLRAQIRKREFDTAGLNEPFCGPHWRETLRAWPSNPQSSLESAEFWSVLDQCQAKLPAKLAAAFRMRELEEMAMTEICDILEINSSNLSVRLHRARLMLRECLEKNWFSSVRQS